MIGSGRAPPLVRCFSGGSGAGLLALNFWNKTRRLIGVSARGWEEYLDRSPFSWLAVGRDVALTLHDNAVDGAEAQACAPSLRLRGEKRIKHVPLYRFRHPGSGIGY